MNETDKISRRRVIGGLGTGLFALTLGSSFVNTGRLYKENGDTPALEDPVGKYPKPPFESQAQPWPGLASKMNPRPDHGESTYKGSGRLTGRKALITGGDSGMGRAAAIAYAREGADIAINYYPTEEPDAQEVITLINKEGRKGIAIPGDIREEAFCKHLVEEAVRRLGGLDILVNNAGRQQAVESIIDLSTEQFDWTMKTNIYAPFWINGLAPGPVWTPLQISGGATQEHVKKFGGNNPFGRPGQPAELASIYVQLADNSGSFANGQIYGSAGGSGQP
jgi:NAD(P)-dependent dehydrogenase (short-subunit alcohol dehydrogenase family)